MDNIKSLQFFLPEVVLTGFILIVILADLVSKIKKGFLAAISIGGILAALTFIIFPQHEAAKETSTAVFLGMLSYDYYAQFFKVAFLLATLIIILFSIPTIHKWKSGVGEYYALLLSCTLGMCLMAGANDLLMMYLSLEFVSVTSYIMAGLLRHNRKSSEASLKYIIYGATASGFMLFGISYLYGLVGTTNVISIGQKLPHTQTTILFQLIVSLLIMAGFAYKIAAVPFHMWCPDVYEGAPTPITAFFSVGPKAAGFAMLIRFLMGVYNTPQAGAFQWKLVLALVCVLTMALGNLAALQQSNLKRLMAYSSIAHAGYLLIGLTIFTLDNISAVMFYVIVYMIMNLGAFLVVIILEEKFRIETVEGCKGLGWREPTLCTIMTIFLFSLTGIPPFAGFAGKLLIFGYTIKGGLFGVSIVVLGVIFSAISLYYYARIVGAMFLKSADATGEATSQVPLYYKALLWLLAIPTIGFGVWWWGWLIDLAQKSASTILRSM